MQQNHTKSTTWIMDLEWFAFLLQPASQSALHSTNLCGWLQTIQTQFRRWSWLCGVQMIRRVFDGAFCSKVCNACADRGPVFSCFDMIHWQSGCYSAKCESLCVLKLGYQINLKSSYICWATEPTHSSLCEGPLQGAKFRIGCHALEMFRRSLRNQIAFPHHLWWWTYGALSLDSWNPTQHPHQWTTKTRRNHW